MLYYLTAVGLLAHTFFWGAGLAGLVLPREWRRWWWAFAPGFGWALQSAVVWAGAHTTLAGTASYARGSELLPLGLLVWWWWRGGGRIPVPGRRAGLLWLAGLLAAGTLLVRPLAQPGPGLTASSLGSCDHADYAAGGRVFQEFSRDDRTGFLGLPEVTRVRSADYFFDVWLRLNHFTPAALLAHHAAVFGVEAYRLVSVSAALLVLLNLPLVLFLARVMLGVRGAWLTGLTALYALSPLSAYAVAHGALGQLYAAQGIALLTVGVFGARRAATRGRSAWVYLPLLLAAFWLLAGSYNFILLVCLAPAGTWLATQLGPRPAWRATGRVLGMLAAALGLCGLFFWGRFDGLLERFSLLEQYNFGWAVPLLSPEGWLGILRDTGLKGWPPLVRGGLSVVVLGFWLVGLVALGRTRPAAAWAALALVLPVLLGWSVLAWEARERAHASYDAFKILSVFYPGLLAGLCCWLPAAAGAGPGLRRLAAAALGLLLVANLGVALAFHRQMSHPPLRADRQLAEVGRLEQEPRVASLNMLIDDYWSRLWANAFLLRKPQYFQVHTYEGRLNTPLKGEWNLSDSFLRLLPLQPEDRIVVNPRFHATRVAAPGLVLGEFADGWYAEEKDSADRWRWSGGAGRLVLTNPAVVPVEVSLRLQVRAVTPRRLEVRLGDTVVAVQPLDEQRQEVVVERLWLAPGRHVLTLDGAGPLAGGPGDPRRLAVALYAFELRALTLGHY